MGSKFQFPRGVNSPFKPTASPKGTQTPVCREPVTPGCPKGTPLCLAVPHCHLPEVTWLSLTFLCFLAIHLSQLLSISSHLDSRCRSTSKGTSSSLWDREEEAGQWAPGPLYGAEPPGLPSTLGAPCPGGCTPQGAGLRTRSAAPVFRQLPEALATRE